MRKDQDTDTENRAILKILKKVKYYLCTLNKKPKHVSANNVYSS